MKKKLFVVLVIVTAVLVTGSLVIGAKKGAIKHVPEKFEMPKFTNKQSATPLPMSAIPAPQSPTPLPPKPPIIRPTPTIPASPTAPIPRAPSIPSSPLSAKEKYAPGELLVKFKPAIASAEINAINQQIGCEVIKEIKFIEVYHLRITSGLSVEEAAERYKQNSSVEFAEPNYRIELRQGVPDDPRVLNNAERWPNDPTFTTGALTYGFQWSLDNWGQTGGIKDADIDAPQMWRMITAADPDIIVAILDTGVDWDHEDLRENIWQNLDEDADGDGHTIELVGGVWSLDPGDLNGVDDDDNNYIDDLIGFDFVGNDNDPDDLNGHGTHVAGIVGAVGNNLIGVTGVCWEVELMPVRISGGLAGDFIANACLGIDYALHEDAKIINASWGFYYESNALRFAIERANDFGVLFVCAAGYGPDLGEPIGVNIDDLAHPEWMDYPPEYPTPNIIAVTASDDNDLKMDVANYGAISIDLAAPGGDGVEIYSTVPGGYHWMSGTSMAAPHVSGVAALCWTLERLRNPGITHLEVKDLLLNDPFSFNAADKEKKPAFQWGAGDPSGLTGEVLTEGRLRAAQNADFGDAPDLPYPTFWPPLGWGALHLDCGLEWLGYDISLERDVLNLDGTDTDGMPNLVNTDGFDDAVTFFPPYFCKDGIYDRADVVVRVSNPISGRYGGAYPVGRFLYLSSFFDFNFDGDWADVFVCPDCPPPPPIAPEHLLIRAVGGPGAFSVVNPLPDDVVVIDPSLWGGPPTQQSRVFELYFCSPPKEEVADTIWTRFRVEYDDQIWPTPDHKFLGTEFDYSLFGEVGDYVIENDSGPTTGCCQLTGYCNMMTEADCNTAGGTWYAAPYECIDDQCEIPFDTLCHQLWDNGSAAWYYSGYDIGDQQGNYFNPETQCPDCVPDVYPFLLTQVSGVLYDFGGAGFHNVNVHIYSVAPDSCAGPGAEIYSFGPVTITTFYPDEVVVPLPEVLCLNEDFIVTFEFIDAGVCVLWTNEAVANCISWLWCAAVSPAWLRMEEAWFGIGYHMIRADGICNSDACAQVVACDLIQDHGAPASYFGEFSAGDEIAEYFDPAVYCDDPVYPYKIHDVDFWLYDFAGVGAVDIIIDVHIVCHDSCDGPGTRIYQSDPIAVTDFYPDWVHLDLPEQVCVWEPFFISLEYATGVSGSTPSFLFDDDVYPCDSCHAWLWYESGGGSPPWIEWNDFWSPPAPGCPIIRVSGFTEHPECQQEPCDTTLVTLWGAITPAYYWKQPPNDEFLNMLFEMPISYSGRLDEIQFAFYAASTQGTPDPDFYVWLSDGVFPLDNNPPYQAIGDFHITYGDIAFYPSYTVVQTWDRGIMLDAGEKFHVGYSHAFEAGDTLSALSDDGGGPDGDRSSGWYDGAWEDYWPYKFMINAVICPIAVPESTFTVACSPYSANAVPGDPLSVKYQVDVGSVLGYNLVVDLSCTPPAGINVSFAPDNVPAPYTSAVSVSVDAGTPYGDYTLTFCGTGSDGQGPKCCDVLLRVQPPFDEATVDFYHGFQRASNFGAVGNDAQDNFMWYGISALFDGSFVIATTDADHMALDVYNCEHWGWLPTQHLNLYYDPVYNANIAYGNFFTPESVISCEYDSVFIVGIMEECIDFSIKIKIYYNPTPVPIYGMYMALFEDWDVGDAYNNFGDMDPDHNLMWQYDPTEDNIVFGMMKAPYYDDPMYNMWFVRNPQYVWPNEGFCDDQGGFWGLDSLYWLMTTPGYFYPDPPDTDFSLMMTAGPIDLLEGERHIEVWIDFGRNLNDGLSWSQWWHRVLKYAGFYRGDVNCDGSVNIGDVTYLLNYLFINGPAPIDYVRFIPQKWTRPSLLENPLWR
jgi:hypothetical protein